MDHRIIQGNCLDVLRTIEPDSIDCAITSPPYWGLRDYQIGPSAWGGDSDCSHELICETGIATWGRGPCAQCGAWIGCLGHEPTPGLFVDHLVDVFEGVRRALKPEGTCWVNIGDSYAGVGKSGGGDQGERWEQHGMKSDQGKGTWKPPPVGLKPKDLCLIPFHFALAVQAAGWWIRSVIIWHKPAPMPESIKDRPTTAHEYIFLLAKSERYFYNSAVARDKDKGTDHTRTVATKPDTSGNSHLAPHSGIRTLGGRNGDGANWRTVWTIGTKQFHGAHFATFPPELVKRCIKAGCPVGGTVLDPFCGSGTTIQVAREFGCGGIGIEMNPEYIAIAERRLAQGVLTLEGTSVGSN